MSKMQESAVFSSLSEGESVAISSELVCDGKLRDSEMHLRANITAESRDMRITFVLPCVDMSGGNRVLATYADRLQRRGHQVQVVSPPHPPLTLKQQLRSLLKGKGWPSRTRHFPSHFDYIDVPHRVVDHYGPVIASDVPNADVVIATWWETAEWVNAFPPEKGAKAYLIQHHEIFDHLPKERVQATYRLPLQKIAISRWLSDLMASEYGDDRCLLVPNSVDTKQFYAAPRHRQEAPTIGMMYSSIGWKGCAVSLEAFALAARKIPNLRLICFGTTPPPPGTLPDNAVFTLSPAQDTLKDLYAQCDVWLCGSYQEGFGLPILEAMACRTPVVSTCVGGAIDLIEPGHNGFIVPVGEAAELANALVQVLNLPETEWLTMSENAYATATSYSWDDATERFEAALQTALADPTLINSAC
jgi:glycosyltransferase involved in cell wall biosynthesis